MLVPFGDDGLPLSEPLKADYASKPWNESGECKAYFEDLAAYKAAKARCLFEGAYFELFSKDNVNGAIWIADTQILNTDINYSRQYWHFDTIEQLATECNVTLSQTFKKEIYGR